MATDRTSSGRKFAHIRDMTSRAPYQTVAAAVIGVAFLIVGSPVTTYAQAANHEWPPEHDAALRRAQVWFPPDTPIETARLGDNRDRRFAAEQTLSCRFEPARVSGNTPKFDCKLPDGNIVRVKYGAANPEVFAEVIASRLLSALGFPTDRVNVVAAVECAGCPRQPFEALQCLGRGGAR